LKAPSFSLEECILFEVRPAILFRGVRDGVLLSASRGNEFGGEAEGASP